MKYRKAYAANPAPRFDATIVRQFAGDIVYVCDTPIFDDLVTDEFKPRFEGRVKEVLKDFDEDKDVIVDFGDALILSMIIFHLAAGGVDKINIARYSHKSNEYVFRSLTYNELIGDEK